MENGGVTLIYCGSKNYLLDRIAQDCGFEYGLRLPCIKYLSKPLYFSDQDWRNPNKDKYINDVIKYRPKMATVLDIEHRIHLKEALDWADKISDFVETIVFIPKCTGVISHIPKFINDKEVILGFSVRSDYGETKLSTSKFSGWKVHLLGGSPERQLKLAKELDVVSLDCNYHSMKANRFGEYWTGKFEFGRWWMKLKRDVSPTERSFEAFRMSCINMRIFWERFSELKDIL